MFLLLRFAEYLFFFLPGLLGIISPVVAYSLL